MSDPQLNIILIGLGAFIIICIIVLSIINSNKDGKLPKSNNGKNTNSSKSNFK